MVNAATDDWTPIGNSSASTAADDWTPISKSSQSSITPAPTSESQFYHNLGNDDELSKFPNVKEDGGIFPIKTTYNPDNTIDSSRVDWSMPLKNLATGVGDLYQQAENKSTDTTPAAVNAMVALSGLPSAGRAAAGVLGDIGEGAAASLSRPSGEFPIAGIPKPKEYDPIATHSAISNSYGAAKAATQPYYNFMREVASGESADASGLKPALSSMISDIENTPFHEAASELPYLRQQATKIDENGTMPLNDMVKLKQNINSNFNPKRFAQGVDTPYSAVGSIVDDSLSDAAERIPDFGEAKALADKNWLNTVKSPFEDNTVLQKFWKPEDYYAKKSVDNGMLEDLPDPTKQRAAEMLSKVKNPVQLDAIRRTLPPDVSDAFSQAKIQDITQGEGVGRMGAAGQVITKGLDLTPSGLANTARNIGNVISPRYKPWQMDLINAAKEPGPQLSTKYQQPFQNMKGLRQQEADSADEMQPFSYSKSEPAPKILALTEDRPMVGGRSAQPRPVTDEEWQGLIDADNYAKKMGLPMDVRKAQQQALISQYERENPSNNFFNTVGDAPIRSSQTALDPRTTGQNSDIFEEKKPFKRGGAVQPTDAQKLAGNYKKEHFSFQGLPVSIENKKGSMRSGKDSNGKGWECTLPCDYGYLKRTTGADKEHIDCFVGPNKKSIRVYIVDQKNHDTGDFDEHKVMLGFPTREEAIKAYRESFSDRKNRIMHVRKMLIPEFKEWLNKGNTKKPIKESK